MNRLFLMLVIALFCLAVLLSEYEMLTSLGNVSIARATSMMSGERSSNNLSELSSERFAIIQFDSRNPSRDTYWYRTMQWNAAYAKRHGHQYLYYSFPSSDNNETNRCISYNDTELLADPWCKVKSMLQAHDDYDGVDFFLYLDSDALIPHHHSHLSLQDLVKNITTHLDWNIVEKPMIFNQDGTPSWWCDKHVKGRNLTWALNAGTVAWYRSPRARQVLQRWWESALDSYANNPIGDFHFRTKWPWEQDRQMAVAHANDTIASYIQISPRPDLRCIPVKYKDWCLSHISRSDCFIAHYCEDPFTKFTMMNRYGNLSAQLGMIDDDDIPTQYLSFE